MCEKYLSGIDKRIDDPESARKLYEAYISFHGTDPKADFMDFYERAQEYRLSEKILELRNLTLSSEQTDPRVFTARNLARSLLFSGETGEILENIEGIPIVYGSVEFGDSRNLDLDLVVFSFQDIAWHDKFVMGNKITTSLIDNWQWSGEPHVRIVTIEEIKKYLASMSPENYDQFVEKTAYANAYPDLDILLSGEPYIQDDRFTAFQEELLTVLEDNRILKALSASCIQDAINIRLERREESTFRGNG